VSAAPEAAASPARVDLAALRDASAVDAVMAELDGELVGLGPVKARVRQIAELLLVERARAEVGLTAGRPSLHMCFTGNPGTGKTTVALRMAEILHRLGYLAKGHLVAVSREDLVGQWVGQTAPKTRETVRRALGGVLFIDEAYALHRPENERDYGQEAVEVLLQAMEEHRERLVVVLAGYRDRMDRFFQCNPGMASRVAHHLEFPDYPLEELLAIAGLMLARQQYVLGPEAAEALREYVTRRMARPRFANARSIRNALDRARMRQASRLCAARSPVGREELSTISAEDIRSSGIFRE
jgi:probable Rubsico expression protein CbbX